MNSIHKRCVVNCAANSWGNGRGSEIKKKIKHVTIKCRYSSVSGAPSILHWIETHWAEITNFTWQRILWWRDAFLRPSTTSHLIAHVDLSASWVKIAQLLVDWFGGERQFGVCVCLCYLYMRNAFPTLVPHLTNFQIMKRWPESSIIQPFLMPE